MKLSFIPILSLLTLGLPFAHAQNSDCKVSFQPVPLAHYNQTRTVAGKINPDANLYVQITDQGQAIVWPLQGPGKAFAKINPDKTINQLYTNPYFSPGGNYLALDSTLQNTHTLQNGRLDIVNLVTGTMIRKPTFIFGGSKTSRFAFFPPSENIFAYVPNDGSEGRNIHIEDLASGKTLSTIHYPFCAIDALAFHPTDMKLAIKDICADAVRIYDAISGTLLQSLVSDFPLPDSYATSVKSLAFWANGTKLAAHSTEHEYAVTWDLASGKESFEVWWFDPLPISPSHDGESLIMADVFGNVNILRANVPNSVDVLTPFGYMDPACVAAFSIQDHLIALASGNAGMVVYKYLEPRPFCRGEVKDGAIQIVFDTDDSFYTLSSKFGLAKGTVPKTNPLLSKD